ncbi:MAG: DUF3109 family protein [Robiginitalea sp.]|jgi:hypothetical protein
MFQIGRTLVSEEILEEAFVCDLKACKGACCIEGSAGAPLEEEETRMLDALFPKVRHYLRPEGVRAIETQGTHVKGSDGDWETPLVEGRECAYVVYEDGVAQCGIEKAHKAGAVSWRKPVSCHLYPVRVREYTQITAVNYHQWHICDAACRLGQKLKVPVYQFTKEALIRKFGIQWYEELEDVASEHLRS